MPPPLYTDNDYLLPPPYHLADMDVLGFWLKGKSQNIQAFLDQRLNIGGGERYVVLTDPLAELAGPLAQLITGFIDYPVLLTLHNIGQLTSQATLSGAPLQDRGFFSYKEAILWVPVFAINPALTTLQNFANGSIPPVRLITPIILADNGLAVAGGREIFGLPKRMGQILLPAIPSPVPPGTDLSQLLAGRSASVLSDVLTTYQRTTLASWRAILDIQFSRRLMLGNGTTPATGWSDLLASIVQQAAGLLNWIPESVVQSVIDAFIDTLVESVKVVAHKELRHGIVDHRESSFSSLNLMEYSIDFESGHIITGLNIDITPHSYASISLTRMLGITAERTRYAFHVRLSGDLTGSTEQRLHP